MPALTTGRSIEGGTVFSQEPFLHAVARAEGGAGLHVLRLRSSKSGACIFGLERIRRLNRRSVSLAPFGLPACPMRYNPSDGCIPDFVGQLKVIKTVSFEWNVRFDHIDLATELTDLGLSRTEDFTNVLYLDRPYEVMFRGFSETTRNQIRRAGRDGVSVHRAVAASDVATYYALYRKVIEERGKWNAVYSKSLFNELFKLEHQVIFLAAYFNDKVIGGAWLIRDGNSLLYWQSAMNYEFKRYFPHYAIIDHAINYAFSEGFNSFNFGASAGISSLEQFKSFWGTRKVPYWTFFWQNPLWSSLYRIRESITW